MRPRNEAELAEAIRGASGPLRIVGGGTRDIGRPVAGEMLSVAGMSGVTLYEPGALTLVARAGTPIAEIEALLAGEGQRLAFEPMDHRVLLGTDGVPTIGGVVAANVSGPRRIQVGAARDFTLGVRFVDGSGQVLKNGGRVMKNVTGYDLVKLMAGSWGTLGVLSEVSLKVLAIPETEATLVLRGASAAEGIAALSFALGSPYDVTGAAHVAAGIVGETSETRLRIEGLEGSVAYRAGRLKDLLGAGEIAGASDSAAMWAELRDVVPFAGRDGAVWRVSVKPSDAPGLVETLRKTGLDCAAIYDWGGGLIWLLSESAPDAGALALRTHLAGVGGHATLVRAAKSVRETVAVFEPEPAPVAAITREIRAKFDPRGILNPGLMGG